MKRLAEARSEVYRALALSFFEPTKDFSDELRSGAFLTSLEKALVSAEAAEEAAGALRSLKKYAKSVREMNLLSFRTQMQVDFTKLFIGVGRPSAPPYESVHRGMSKPLERRLVMGDPVEEVKKEYAREGLTISTDCKELPDHAGLELEFMHFLTRKEAEAWKQGNEAEALRKLRKQKSFLSKHLMRWFPKFCGDVDLLGKESFYAPLAGIAKTFVLLESNRVGPSMMLAKPSAGRKDQEKSAR